jgi:hypothetical protein
MESPRSLLDAAPLIQALERIRDAGRKRKEAGIDDAAVGYARLANDALLWMAADADGRLDQAERHLDDMYGRNLL